MRRKLFNLAAVISLMLCVAVVVLWARGSRVLDGADMWRIRRESDGSVSDVSFRVSSSERLWLRMSFGRLGRPGQGLNWDSYYERADARGGRWGFQPFHQTATRPDDWSIGIGATGWGPLRWHTLTQFEPAVPFVQRNVTVGISHWVFALLLAILPIAAGRRLLHHWLQRPKHAGLCRVCGYDLRATPERCPECGTLATPRESASVKV